MKRIKTEVSIIGNGAAAMLAANRLMTQGMNVVLINPCESFGVEDIRSAGGLGLWNAAYRAEKEISLPDLYDELVSRLREVFPGTLEHSGFQKTEHWSILSSTPVHRSVTEEFEREYFKLERKPWSASQLRLVNPEHVITRIKRLGLFLPNIAQVEGGVVRSYAVSWDAAKMGFYLLQFIHHKIRSIESEWCFTDVDIEGKYGRKIVLSRSNGDEVSIESEKAVLIFLTGEILPRLKSIVSACEEPWIQGIRKRRREQHHIWFEKARTQSASDLHGLRQDQDIWLEVGQTKYQWSDQVGSATWQSGRGPDGLERVVDEGLRLQSSDDLLMRFVRASRAFKLEWDWKNPQWRDTSHQTHWATSYEGDLWATLELLWNLPSLS